MATREWVFQQVGGSRKRLTLSGWAAPFGRPRQGAVVETAYAIRHQRTRYPGSKSVPTTHLFGPMHEDWELHGRWMDKDLGPGGAIAKRDEWEKFIADQQQVTIAWGDILSYTGIVQKLTIGFESEHELVWKLHILIDSKDSDDLPVPIASPTLRDFTGKLDQSLAAFVANGQLSVPKPDIIRPTLFDTIDDLVSVVASVTAKLNEVTSGIDSIEKATFDQLEHLRGAVHAVKTATLQLHDTLTSIDDDAALFDRQVDDELVWLKFRREAEVHAVRLAATAQDLDDYLFLKSGGGTAKLTYTAKPGDSWESISTRFYGDASKANDIRSANGVRFGEQPLVGKSYVIPAR